MRNRPINCNSYNVQRKPKTLRCYALCGSHRVKRTVPNHNPASCSVSSISGSAAIRTLSIKQNLSNSLYPWPRRAPPSPLAVLDIFFSTDAFKSLCLSSTSADLLPGILSAQPEASSFQPKRTQPCHTSIHHRSIADSGAGFYQLNPDHVKTSLLDLFVSYAHVMFTFCPPQVHQHKHHPQNPRVDHHSHRASSRVSVCVCVCF